ncbi:MAG: DNA helicase RecQ [Candidatus Magasanikbacteria bacterium]
MTIQDAKQTLKKYFGFNSFRPMQEDIIQAVLDGKDTVVLMPTGGGKSLCYQLPGILMPGVTIVVSPLIALMKDQVEGLVENGVRAAYINSSVHPAEVRDIMDGAKSGEVKLLYVSPEKLVSEDFQYFLHELDISLFAIDEAHCISSWGHDFRREYTQLRKIKASFPKVPVIALTATADKLTRKDIVYQLSLQHPEIFISSFDRPNLKLTVLPARKRKEKIIHFVKRRPGESGIIYCLSRKQTERVADALVAENISAAYYHAGMQSHERTSVQEDFIHGRTDIIVATIAFGMGIDKSNVRFVIHHNLPKNIEGYYQEIGRAGRDGLPSDTLLFYTLADVVLLKKFAIESGQPDLQIAKLERMQQYADALICRRKILLSYFDEGQEENCNNCDVCENPPELFDGSRIAQIALSAIARTKESVAAGMLIDILRGSEKYDVMSHGFNTIKTYGKGKDMSSPHWQQYILQMLNMGLVGIAYDRGNALTLTDIGKEVLLGNRNVQFVTIASIEDRALEHTRKGRVVSKRKEAEEELFDRLRELRKSIAHKLNIPPYLVFNDSTLDAMAADMPITEESMKQISGVGDKKYASYGNQFIDAITAYMKERDKGGKKIQGTTQEVTYAYFRQNMPVPQIARERNLSEQTIYGHLADMYEKGHDIDISKFIDRHDLKKIIESLKEKGVPKKLKTLHERFDGKFDYHKLKLAIAHYRVNNERGIVRYD